MCDNADFLFEPITPFREWNGFYSRIPGHTTTFTITYNTDYASFWPIIRHNTDDGLLICPALEGGDVELLIETINEAKMQMTGQQGGSFCINEFGQVIVPSSDGDGMRLLVGQCEGVLLFEGEDEIIDLSDDCGLDTGDCWEKPYIGMKYQLHRDSFVYYWNDCLIEPVAQDEDLICKMRSVRRYGAATFIVNPYGIVLMKSPAGAFSFDEDKWKAVYVGRINYDLWFRKEKL
jgi:hypothetical protein